MEVGWGGSEGGGGVCDPLSRTNKSGTQAWIYLHASMCISCTYAHTHACMSVFAVMHLYLHVQVCLSFIWARNVQNDVRLYHIQTHTQAWHHKKTETSSMLSEYDTRSASTISPIGVLYMFDFCLLSIVTQNQRDALAFWACILKQHVVCPHALSREPPLSLWASCCFFLSCVHVRVQNDELIRNSFFGVCACACSCMCGLWSRLLVRLDRIQKIIAAPATRRIIALLDAYLERQIQVRASKLVCHTMRVPACE